MSSLRNLGRTAGRRFARLTTDAVVRRPALWTVFRRLMQKQFARLAPGWDEIIEPDHLAPLERALGAVREAPRRVLDVGTGTGAAALLLARHWPEAEVTGVDLAPEMLEVARRKTPPELAGRVRFEPADASKLPFPDSSFDFVSLANMIPFFDELARVAAPNASIVFSFSGGADTPIYVPPERLRRELERRGFTEFADFATGRGTSFLARRGGQD